MPKGEQKLNNLNKLSVHFLQKVKKMTSYKFAMKYKLKLLSLNARLSHASLFIVLKSGYFRKLEKLRLPRQTMVAKYSHLISFLQ